MWVKQEVNKLSDKGVVWEWATEKGEASPAISEIFLSTFFGMYKLKIKGTAAEKLFAKLKTGINPDYFKELSPAIDYMFSTIDINLRKILEKSGSEELQIILKNVYELINSVTPSFISIQAELEHNISTHLLLEVKAYKSGSSQANTLFFSPPVPVAQSSEQSFWVKKEINETTKQGIAWKCATEKGEASPAIHTIFLSTAFDFCHLKIEGRAAEKLFAKLKTAVNSDYFKGLFPVITCILSTIDINLREILEKSGSEELQILLKNVYGLINSVSPSFFSIQAELDHNISTNLFLDDIFSSPVPMAKPSEQSIWVKKEVNKTAKQGIAWECSTEKGEASPAIHKIFLSTNFDLYKLKIEGTAAERLFAKLKTEINPIYFKGLLPAINCRFSSLDINLREILEQCGLEELQIILKIVYKLINFLTPSFSAIQAELEHNILTNLLLDKKTGESPPSQAKTIFFSSSTPVAQSSKNILKETCSITASDIAAVCPGRGYNFVAASYDSLTAEWGNLKKGIFSGKYEKATIYTVKIFIEPSLDSQVLSFTEKHKATQTFEYNYNEWETISTIYFDIQFRSESQAASFLEGLYQNPEVIKFQEGMDRNAGCRGEKIAVRTGDTIQIENYPGIKEAIKILSSDTSLCPYEALVDYLKKTFTRGLEINPYQEPSTTLKA